MDKALEELQRGLLEIWICIGSDKNHAFFGGGRGEQIAESHARQVSLLSRAIVFSTGGLPALVRVVSARDQTSLSSSPWGKHCGKKEKA